jgi:nucleotide-binding universal stress UspA family protein
VPFGATAPGRTVAASFASTNQRPKPPCLNPGRDDREWSRYRRLRQIVLGAVSAIVVAVVGGWLYDLARQRGSLQARRYGSGWVFLAVGCARFGPERRGPGEPKEGSIATIVVGTDGSKGSEAALSEGFDLAKRLGAKVLVVAVFAHVSDLLGGSVYERRLSEHLDRARAALDAARRMAEEAGVEAEFEIFEGDAAEEIAMIAERRDADLVVVGTRGHGGIAGSLLGSVSADVVRRSRRPVVVVHEPS